MKILIVNKFLYPNGGSETYIFELGKELKRQGHEVEYFGMADERNVVGNSAGILTSNMDFHGSGLGKLLYPFKILWSGEAYRAMGKVLSSFDPDVVHLNNFNFQLTPSVISAVKKHEKKAGKKITIVYTAHDYQLICPNHMCRCVRSGKNCTDCIGKGFRHCIKGRCIHGSFVRSVLGAAEGSLYRMRHTYRKIDRIVCPTKFMKDKLDLYEDLKGRTVALLNFAIPVEEVSKETSGKDPYVLYFGRFSEEKGIGTLLSACRNLPDIPFIFAGRGPMEEEVRAVPNVTVPGFLSKEELAPLIRDASFSIYPSEWYENCPFSVMESIQYGTPVLGADIGGIPELIQDGYNGELFKSGDASALTEKIKKLWNDRERLSRYSENALATEYASVSEYTEKLLKIYEGRD